MLRGSVDLPVTSILRGSTLFSSLILQDEPKTLFYLDPLHLHETRASTETYKHEMTEDEHRELLASIPHAQDNAPGTTYTP